MHQRNVTDARRCRIGHNGGPFGPHIPASGATASTQRISTRAYRAEAVLRTFVSADLWADVLNTWNFGLKPTSRDAALEAIELMQPMNWSALTWSAMLCSIDHLVRCGVSHLIEVAEPMRKSGCKPLEWQQAVLALNYIAVERRPQVCRLVAACMQNATASPMSDDGWPELIYVLASCTSEQAERLVGRALTLRAKMQQQPCILGPWTPPTYRALVVAFAVSPVQDAERWYAIAEYYGSLSHLQPLWCLMLKSHAALPEAHWDECREHLDMSISAIYPIQPAYFLQSYVEQEPDHRNEFSRALIQVAIPHSLGPVLSGSDQYTLINTLKNIPPEDRLRLATLATAIRYSYPSTALTRATFEFLSCLPANRQCAFAAILQRFIADSKAGRDALILLRCLAASPVKAEIRDTIPTDREYKEICERFAAFLVHAKGALDLQPFAAAHIACFWPLRREISATLQLYPEVTFDKLASSPQSPLSREQQVCGFFRSFALMADTPLLANIDEGIHHGASPWWTKRGELNWGIWSATCKNPVILNRDSPSAHFHIASVVLANLMHAGDKGASQPHLLWLAKYCSDSPNSAGDGLYGLRGLRQYVPYFALQSESDRVELVWHAFNEWDDFEFFADSVYLGEEYHRFEIAKCAIKRSPETVGTFIRRFRVRELQNRVQLAEMCAAAGAPIILTIDEFELDSASRKRIVAGVIIDDPELIWRACEHDDAIAALVNRLENASVGDWDAPMGLNILTEFIENTGFEPTEWRWSKDILAAVTHPRENMRLTLGLAANIFYMRYSGPIDVSRWLNQKGLLQSLYAMRAPFSRTPILKALTLAAADTQFRDRHDLQPPLKLARFPEGRLLQAILVACRCAKIEITPLERALEKGCHGKFKDAPKRQILLHTVSMIYTDVRLTSAEKTTVFARIVSGRNASEIYNNVCHTRVIYDFGRTAMLRDHEVSLSSLVDALIGQRLQGLGVDQAAERFLHTFAQCRAASAVWRYAANLATLSAPEVDAAMADYLRDILLGQFEENRNDIAANVHLAQIQSTHADVLTAWRMGSVAKLQRDVAAAPWDACKWLRQVLLTDGHLGHYLQKMPRLTPFLAGHLDNPQRRRFLDAATAKMATGPVLPQDAVQVACMRLGLAEPADQKDALAELHSALRSAHVDTEFVHDVAGQLQRATQNNPSRPHKDLTVVDTSDPYLMLMSGTDVHNSCQRLDGSPHQNRGLLGYLLNGHVRLIAVVDPDSGHIVARAICELLCSETATGESWEPVLYLERVYGDESFAGAIERTAQTKAMAMGIPLTSAEGRSPFGRSVASLGGRSPCLYSDAIGGIADDSQFEVEAGEVELIWPPAPLWPRPARRYTVADAVPAL